MKNDQRKIWLNYFNEVLFEKGVITEAEKNRMIRLIEKESQIFNKN